VKRGMVDAVGHYARPDVVQVLLKRFGGETLQMEPPRGLSGERIPHSDRVRSVADKYDLDEDVLREAVEVLLGSSGRPDRAT
jgi:hypothetical protein